MPLWNKSWQRDFGAWQKAYGTTGEEQCLLKTDLVLKVSKHGQFVLNLLLKMLSVAIVCLPNEMHLRFVGCDKDVNWLPKLKEVWWKYTQSRLWTGTDLIWASSLMKLLSVYLAAVERRRWKALLDLGGAVPEEPSNQSFEKNILTYLCALQSEYFAFDLAW